MKFLIIPNITREKAVDFAFTAAETVLKKGHKFAVMPEAKEIFSTHFSTEISDDIENADMAVVIGGDGTVLRYTAEFTELIASTDREGTRYVD